MNQEETQGMRFILHHIAEELELISGLYRKKANYKRYSQGMRRAFSNRAWGIEKASKVVQNIFPDDEL